jgi:hypothetical protein
MSVLFLLAIVVGGIASALPQGRHLLTPSAAQASGDLGYLSGQAWSDNIGWINFSDPNATVIVKSDGTLSGAAWSDNIGWVDFDANSCGTPHISGTAVTGSAKATVADGNGWDGCISLDTASTPVTLPGGTGASGPFSGQAWSDSVVGWVDFSGVTFNTSSITPPGFGLTLTAAPSKVRSNTATPVTFTWSGGSLVGPCSLASLPAISGFPVNGLATNPGGGSTVQNVTLTQLTQFTLTCGAASGQTTVGVTANVIEI